MLQVLRLLSSVCSCKNFVEQRERLIGEDSWHGLRISFTSSTDSRVTKSGWTSPSFVFLKRVIDLI